ncbi:MAG: DUF3971 domain-containing protein [Halieaceae bacterium]
MGIERVHYILGKLLWRALLFLVVLLAVYVSGTRFFFSGLPAYREAILDAVNQQFDSTITLSEIGGDLNGFTPALMFRDLHVVLTPAVEIRFTEARASLDPWASLLAMSPRLGALLIDRAEVLIDLDSYAAAESKSSDVSAIEPFSVFENIVFTNASVMLFRDGVASDNFDASLQLEREGSQLRFQGLARGPGGAELSLGGSGIGGLASIESFEGAVYAQIRIPNINAVSGILNAEGVGVADLDLWYQSTTEKRQLTFQSAVRDFGWRLYDSKQATLNQASLSGVLRQTEGNWDATINNLSLGSTSSLLVVDKLQLSGGEDGAITARVSEFDVANATQTLIESGFLPKNFEEVLAILEPSGTVYATTLSLPEPDSFLDTWSVQAEIKDASVKPYKKVPGLYGIDATVEANQDAARAWIDTEDFTLDLPLVYDQPIEIKRIEGWLDATWSKNFLRLHNGVLMADTDEHPAQVLFGIDIPLNKDYAAESPVAMYLDVGFEEAPVSVRDFYIPNKVPEALDLWLDSALLQGIAKTGLFVWRGPFKNFGAGVQSMQLAAEIDSATIQYHADWPVVKDADARLFVDTTDVALWSDRAESKGLNMSDLVLMTSRKSAEHQLLMQGDIAGTAQGVLDFLTKSPIDKKAGGLLDDLESSGSVTGDLQLGLRLDDISQDVHVVLRTDLSDAALHSKLLNITLSDVSGGLDFEWQAGFSDRDLSASLFGRPISIEIGRGTTGRDGADLLDAKFIADLGGTELKSWFDDQLTIFRQPALDNVFSGETRIEVELVVGEQAEVFLHSDLAGLGVNLPAPLGKNPSAVTPLALSFDLAPSGDWEGFWDSRLTARITREKKQTGLLIDVTPRSKPDFSEIDSGPTGLVITGTWPELILDPWVELYLEITENTEEGLPAILPTVTELDIEALLVREESLGPVTLSSRAMAEWWTLDFAMPDIEGSFAVPANGDIPELVLHELNFGGEAASDASTDEIFEAALDGEASPEPVEVASLDDAPPALRSPLNVTLSNLSYRGEPLGALAFQLRSEEETLFADEIRGSLATAVIKKGSQLRWEPRGEDIWGSGFTGVIGVADLADTFGKFGLEPAARSDTGEFDINVNWLGAPTEVGLQKLDGDVHIRLEGGSFLPVSNRATGAVRLFSLLNLAGLLQRANVTQLFEPGVAFSLAEGDLNFTAGTLAIPKFSIDGPGGGFSFTSDVDFVNEIIDGELTVTLPLVDNIPWVAALAGGLPLAAGAYLMSKVFEDQVKTLSSAVYDVSGSLSAPDVEFVRLFDASAAQSESAQVESDDEASSSSRR